MMNSSKNCQLKGHSDYNSSHICTFQGCNLGTRWVCAECFAEQIHKHNQNSNSHIMNKQQFQMFLNQQQKNDNQNNKKLQAQVQSYIHEIMKLLEIVNQFVQFLQNCQKEIDDYRSLLNKQYQVDHNWFSLSDDQITQLLNKQNKKQFQFDNQELLTSVQQIKKYLQQSIIKNSQQKQQMTNSFSYEIKDYVKLEQNNYICTAQISTNEKYLAYGGWEKLCIIYDLSLNKQIKSIKLDQVVNGCLFSNDSQLLYIGCWDGYLYCIDIANNCKEIYKQQLNQHSVFNIKEQQNQVIITSHDTDIIITNIKLQQQILKIHNAHNDQIYGLDYNKMNDVIVSGSEDKSIKFFNGLSGLLLIQKQQSHHEGILKIQLINQNKLASLSGSGILKYWLVDYQNKELILLNQIKDENKIINFDFINEKQIVTICKKYFQILDQDYKVVKHIQHSQNDDVKFRQTNQFNSMNYVIICGEMKFTVMRKLQKHQ